MNGYPIFFEAIPAIGTVIPFGGTNLTLVKVGQYEKANGTPSTILEWLTDENEICTSGLRGKGVYWRSIEDANYLRSEAQHKAALS